MVRRGIDSDHLARILLPEPSNQHRGRQPQTVPTAWLGPVVHRCFVAVAIAVAVSLDRIQHRVRRHRISIARCCCCCCHTQGWMLLLHRRTRRPSVALGGRIRAHGCAGPGAIQGSVGGELHACRRTQGRDHGVCGGIGGARRRRRRRRRIRAVPPGHSAQVGRWISVDPGSRGAAPRRGIPVGDPDLAAGAHRHGTRRRRQPPPTIAAEDDGAVVAAAEDDGANSAEPPKKIPRVAGGTSQGPARNSLGRNEDHGGQHGNTGRGHRDIDQANHGSERAGGEDGRGCRAVVCPGGLQGHCPVPRVGGHCELGAESFRTTTVLSKQEHLSNPGAVCCGRIETPRETGTNSPRVLVGKRKRRTTTKRTTTKRTTRGARCGRGRKRRGRGRQNSE
mmetsp:Transcript_25193/g.59410  ORF Transcript_25193/g.59410 Transcript_25193/m.59410 type:complete len:392 (-) Transcript_25193:1076-2251(-)